MTFFYIINIVELSSVFVLFLILKFKNHNIGEDNIKIEIEIKRNQNYHLIRKKYKRIYNLKSERSNINKSIDHDNKNSKDKSKQNKMDSPQPLITNHQNGINNNIINKPKERTECNETLKKIKKMR